MRYTNCSVLSASGNATGSAIDATPFEEFSVLSSSTGTLTGSLQMQASNDPCSHPGSLPTNWSNIGSAISVTAASQLNAIIPCSYMWVRAVFSGAGGTGTLVVRLKSNGH